MSHGGVYHPRAKGGAMSDALADARAALARLARMAMLRTPKEATGMDLGIPSLTARAWYEARFGRSAWESIQTFPRKAWREYLDWFRDVLDLQVENEVEVTAIEPSGDLLLAHLRRGQQVERIIARKIVLAVRNLGG